MRMMVVVFMVVLNLLLMLLLMVVLMLLMVWGHVLTVAPLGCHVAPMIPLVMHIMMGEPRGRGSHGGRSSNTHNYTLTMTGEHDTVTRVGVLGGGVGLMMTHTASTVAPMSVSHRRGRGKSPLRGGQPHGDTSHLLSCLGQANQWS